MRKKVKKLSGFEFLECRRVLASIFPAYVDGQFEFGDTAGFSPYGLENTFKLSSNPTATKTIYIDFDGHHSVNNGWGHNIEFPAFDRNSDLNSFSDAELLEIQKVFQNVAEDFMPFDVNVTTEDPGIDALTKSNSADQAYGVRTVATQATDGFGDGIGGVARFNVFNDSRDVPVFAFNKGPNNGAMTVSHEVGHALGLFHDGLGSQQYHPGVSNGSVSWGPIMGAPFGKNLTQWSNGDYSNATNFQDDLAIITNNSNGIEYKVDDHGGTLATSSELSPTSGELFAWGTIERNTDTDWFSFYAGTGTIDVDVLPLGERPNLDIQANLYDSQGNLIVSRNPGGNTIATFTFEATEDTYYLEIDGVGRAGRYSDYGSLGFYSIDIAGDLSDPSLPSGDFDADGDWDLADIDQLTTQIVDGGGTLADFDMNGDGSLDALDRDEWLAAAGANNLASGLPYLLGDADLDGVVDVTDYAAWNANKFTPQALWSAGDFTVDGQVDASDFAVWNTNKFQSALGSAALVAGNKTPEIAEGEWLPTGHFPGDGHDHDGHEDGPQPGIPGHQVGNVDLFFAGFGDEEEDDDTPRRRDAGVDGLLFGTDDTAATELVAVQPEARQLSAASATA